MLQFESRQSPSRGRHPERSRFSGGAQDLARRPAARPEKLHARSLTRLNGTGFGMTPSKGSPNSQTAPLPRATHATKKARIAPGFSLLVRELTFS